MKEQDEVIVITVLCGLISKLTRLYQLTNWSQQNTLELADWIYDNYKFEMFSSIYEVLKNPPPVTDENGNMKTTWRLTPDTIRAWIAPTLEKVAVQREHWHENKNAKMSIEPIEGLEKQYKEIRERRVKEWEVEEEKKKMKQKKYEEMQERWRQRFLINADEIEEQIKKRDEDYLKQTGHI